MSQKHPECPLTNPMNCKDYNKQKICAFVRKDKTCQKKKSKTENRDDQKPAEKPGKHMREMQGDEK